MKSKKVKIGFDVSDLATNRADGTTRYTRELAGRLPGLQKSLSWQYFAPGKFDIKSMSNVEKIISPWPKYWTQSRLPLDLIKNKPDVLFMPIQQIPYLRSSGLKTVAVIHDLAFHKYSKQITFKDWLLLHIFTAYVAKHADQIIAVSQATADDIARYYGRVENVSVVHHGLNHEQFYLPQEDERQKSWLSLKNKYPKIKSPYILYVGQIQPRKNIVRLIEAFELLAEKDKELQLVIAGSHGWLQKPIFEAIAKSPFKDRIILTDRVDDDLLSALYWHAEVYVLPSLYEGFGMPILEAMACGCPVVTSDISSMPEVADGAGLLVDPLDIDSIAHGILEARENRSNLIEQGLSRAKDFTWDKTARQTLDVIQKVLT